jgi:hypothetical protein
MPKDGWIPDVCSPDVPNAGRMYDYWLGGYHNFETDRKAADWIQEKCPAVRSSTYANRGYLRRAVTFLLSQGIDQFLDLGSGIPTAGNVHEVAQAVNPAVHVVYVDVDPVAVAHGQAILQHNPQAAMIQADVGQPQQYLEHDETKRLMDWSKPAAILCLTVLHYILDDDRAYRVVRTLRDKLAPGSYMAISHMSYDGVQPETVESFENLGIKPNLSAKVRTRAEIAQFFEGFELLEPGVVHIPLWRPESPTDILLDQPGQAMGLAGVGRKP